MWQSPCACLYCLARPVRALLLQPAYNNIVSIATSQPGGSAQLPPSYCLPLASGMAAANATVVLLNLRPWSECALGTTRDGWLSCLRDECGSTRAAAALAEAARDPNDNALSEWTTATTWRPRVNALERPRGTGHPGGGIARLTVRRGIVPDANAESAFEALRVTDGVPHAAACVIPSVIPDIADTDRDLDRATPRA